MTLKEEIALRNRMHPPANDCVEMECHAVATITFCPWQGSVWILPWSRFEAMRFVDEDNLERMELYFPHHHIIAVGEHLRKTLGSFRKFEVSFLRSFPVAHRACLEPKSPFIAQLEVQLLADPKSGPAIDAPF